MTLQDVLNIVATDAAKARTVLLAVAGSPITQEAEALIPGLAKLVANFTPVGNVLGAVSAAVALERELAALGAKPMDASAIAAMHYDLEHQ